MKPPDPNLQQQPAPAPATKPQGLDELFEADLEQQTAALTQNLLEVDRGELGPEILQNLMRAAHSIKGAARIANRRSAVRIAHNMEECFVLAQHGAILLTRADVDVLLKAVDFVAEHKGSHGEDREDQLSMELAGHLANLERIASRSSGKAGPPTRVSHGPPAENPLTARPKGDLRVSVTEDRYLRLTTANLNRLLGLANETMVEAQWLRPFADALHDIQGHHRTITGAVEKLRLVSRQPALGGAGRAQLDSVSSEVAKAGRSLAARLQELEMFDQRATQVSRQLYLEVLRTRMRPLHDLFRKLPRMVRDLARVLGKQVRLEIRGEGTPVDREVLERIETPLVHLLRNAVDHGCETPEVRKSCGKAPEAIVRVEARHSAGMLSLMVSDDGVGIESRQLRERVANLNLAPAAVLQEIGDKELLDYLFLPGFTMRHSATEISGRGVGLDLVQNMVRNLHGNIRVVNRPGRGMEFHLHVPLTISVMRALLIEVADEPYALPLGRIGGVLKIKSEDILPIQGIPHLQHAGKHIALADARQLLGFSAFADFSGELHVVVLTGREPRYGLVVGGFLGQRELIVQPLDPRLGKVREISGASLMEDGAPLLVIDVDEAVQSLDRLALQGRLNAEMANGA